MPTRLQLGTSRLEKLNPKVLNTFLNKTWIHLGEPEQVTGINYSDCDNKAVNKNSILSINKILGSIRNAFKSVNRNTKRDKIYHRTNFLTFFYNKNSCLPFKNNSIDYIFSEHFFEHLFLDEALSLFKECHRVLKPKGVIRTCVPDADLRIYESPEPTGYPNKKMSYCHPDKHKTRWSIYSLSEILRLSEFEPVPLNYCDKFGNYIQLDPLSIKRVYEDCLDQEMIFDFKYISRINSLIVDGIKKNSCVIF